MARSSKGIGWSELRVGIFTFIALAVLIILLLNASGNFNPFERKIRLRARFPSADGLRAGADVQLAGLTIGEVKDVRLLPPDSPENEKIEATFSVSAEVDGKPITERIRTDSTAKLFSTTLLGNEKVILISAGSANGADVTPDYVLPSSTQSSINQLTESGDKLINQLNELSVPVTDIANRVNRGEGTVGKFFTDEEFYRNLNATLRETEATIAEAQEIAARLQRGEGTAGKLLSDDQLYNRLNNTVAQLDRIAVDLRQGRGSAGKFLRDERLYNELNATVADTRAGIARINQIADRFEPIVIDLREGRGTAGKFLRDEQLYNDAQAALDKFNSTATRVENIVAAAERGEGTIGKLLRDETLYNNVNQISSEGTKLIYDFRQNPRKYLTIKFELF